MCKCVEECLSVLRSLSVCIIAVLTEDDWRVCVDQCTVEPLLYDHPQNHIGVVV